MVRIVNGSQVRETAAGALHSPRRVALQEGVENLVTGPTSSEGRAHSAGVAQSVLEVDGSEREVWTTLSRMVLRNHGRAMHTNITRDASYVKQASHDVLTQFRSWLYECGNCNTCKTTHMQCRPRPRGVPVQFSAKAIWLLSSS